MYTDTWHGKASQMPFRESTQIYPGIDKEGIYRWESRWNIRPKFYQRLVYINPRFDGHPWQYMGTPPMGDLLYRVINPYILMLYTAYSPPQTKFVAVMGWDRDLVIFSQLNSVNTQWHI